MALRGCWWRRRAGALRREWRRAAGTCASLRRMAALLTPRGPAAWTCALLWQLLTWWGARALGGGGQVLHAAQVWGNRCGRGRGCWARTDMPTLTQLLVVVAAARAYVVDWAAQRAVRRGLLCWPGLRAAWTSGSACGR